MTTSTREQFLDQAEILFAERGFYGVSIAAIADELGLTKQALLHHFGSKEKIYGEVLKRISDQFAALQPTDTSEEPQAQFLAYLLNLHTTTRNQPERTALLIRELLDNRQRAEAAGTWYLRSFLERLVLMLKETPAWQSATNAEALAAVYQLLGAINYYSISEPTLTGIVGKKSYRDLDRAFSPQLEDLIRSIVSTGQPGH